jgi:hypothetical protein
VLALLAWSRCASAQTDASASVSFPFGVSSLLAPPSSCSAITNPAICELSGNVGYDNAAGAASGNSGYGYLSTSTTLSSIGNHYGGEGTVTADTSASFSDALTFQNAPTSGTLMITLAYSEQTQVACNFGLEIGCAGSAAVALIGAQPNPVTASSVANPTLYPTPPGVTIFSVSPNTQSSGTFVEDLPYSSSSASLYFALTSSSSCQVIGFGGEFCDSQTNSFIRLEDIKVLDSFGNVISGATVTAASGTDYSPVPLPAAVWLLLSALSGLGAFSRNRSSIAA